MTDDLREDRREDRPEDRPEDLVRSVLEERDVRAICPLEYRYLRTLGTKDWAGCYSDRYVRTPDGWRVAHTHVQDGGGPGLP